MSIETAIERVADKIAESYQVVREKGGALPVEKNVHNLPDAIRTIDGDFAFGSYEWWCPNMTGPHSPEPYAVGAHIWNTTDTPWKAFDGSDETYWGNVYSNTIKTAHLKFDFGESTKIAGVQLVEYANQPGGLPKTIAIYGSDDDEHWDEIIVDDHSTWSWCESPRNISFDVVKYRFYRIDCKDGTWITDDVTDSYTIAIGEIQLATFKRDLSYCPVITLQDKTASPLTEPQDISADEGYTGLSTVTVEAAELESKTVRSSLEPQTVVADEEYYGLGEVTVDPFQLQTKEVAPNLRAQTVTPDDGYDGLSEVTVTAAKLQKKTVDPTHETQTIVADTGFYGLSKLTVNPIPDVIPPEYQEKVVSPSEEEQEITADEGYDALSKVVVEAAPLQEKIVKSSTEAQTVIADEGNYGLSEVTVDPYILQEKTIAPAITSQKVTADESYDALSEVTVEAVPLQEKDVDTSMTTQVVSPDEGYLGLSEVTIAPPKTQEKVVTPSEIPQEVVSDDAYDALSKVTVEKIPEVYKDTSDATVTADDILAGKVAYGSDGKVVGTAAGTSAEAKLQEKTITPTTSVQKVGPDEEYDALSEVTVEKIPEVYKDTSDATASADDILEGKTAYINGEKVTGTAPGTSPEPNFQEKTATPSESKQDITPDADYDALSKVTVEKIPSVYKDTSDATAGPSDILTGKTAYVNGEKVTGTASISEDVDYDWWSPRMTSNTESEATLAHANLQIKTATPTATPQVVQPDSGYDGLSQVSISGDENLVAGNIKDGVSIFGVDGSYTGATPKLQTKTVTPRTYSQSITPDSDYDGLSELTVDAVNLGQASVGPSTSVQVIEPTSPSIGFAKVIVGAIPSEYKDTSDATASATDILSGKTAYVNGSKVTGTYTTPTPSLQAKTVTPTKSSQSVTPDSSYDGLSKVTVNAIPSSYITTTDATASASDILSGKTAYVNGEKVTGSASSVTVATPSIVVSSSGLITASTTQSGGFVTADTKSATKQLTTKAAATITPGTTSKTIASETYLTGTQTISGDANLVASNIKSGVSIFGVSGSYVGSPPEGTIDPSKFTIKITINPSTNSTTHILHYMNPLSLSSRPGSGEIQIPGPSSDPVTFDASIFSIFTITRQNSTSSPTIKTMTYVSQTGESNDKSLYPMVWSSKYNPSSAMNADGGIWMLISNVNYTVTFSGSQYVNGFYFGGWELSDYTGTNHSTIELS